MVHFTTHSPVSEEGKLKAVPTNSGQFVDGAGAEISRLLKTECNVIAGYRTGKMGRGILVHEWCCFSDCASHIALQCYLHSCCTLEFCSMLVSESHGLTPRQREGRCVPDFYVKCESSVSSNQDTLKKVFPSGKRSKSLTHSFVHGSCWLLSVSVP